MFAPLATPYAAKGTKKKKKAINGIPIKLCVYFIIKICLVLIGSVNKNSKSVAEYKFLNTCGIPIRITIPIIMSKLYEKIPSKIGSVIEQANRHIAFENKNSRIAKTPKMTR